MRLFVHFDKDGKIISAMEVNVMPEGMEHPFGGVKEDEKVAEIGQTSDIESLELHEISEHYDVDVKSGKLVAKEKSKSGSKHQSRKGKK